MTQRSNSKLLTPFANTERHFRARRDLTPISVHNIFSFNEYESSKSESKEMAEVDIDTLTMDQYIALTRQNQGLEVTRPEIGNNVSFEINGQCMHELRENTFIGNRNDDAHEHVQRVLDIVSLFIIPDVTHDVVMLRVFPITLIGAANR
ncbi:hypothetical protein Tco_0636864 [Tanacetum coccineum]